jgi:hypothetical protein
MARMAATRSTSSRTKRASVWNVLPADGDEGVHRRPADERLGPAAVERKIGPPLGGRIAILAKDLVALGVEHLEREVVEAIAQVAVGAVVDGDVVDRHLLAQIDLPPGAGRVLGGVRLAAGAVGAVAVAVDGLLRVAAVGRVLLRRFGAAGDVAAFAHDLDLGQSQRRPAR